jgi:hypothetical protein
MLANQQFKMRVSPKDRAMLRYVARHFQRSQAGTIKTLVREVYQVIKAEQVEGNKNDNSQHIPA